MFCAAKLKGYFEIVILGIVVDFFYLCFDITAEGICYIFDAVFDIALGALHYHFHCAIVQVAYKALELQSACNAESGKTKPDALNGAFENNMSRYYRHNSICNIKLIIFQETILKY